MSGPTRRSPLRDRLRGVPLVSGGAYVLAMAVLVAAAAWPIYQSPYFLVAAGGAVLLGIGVALLSLIRRWSWFTTLLVTVGAYLVFGVPLAVPSGLGGVQEALRGFLELLGRSVFGWKELVTIALPVGSYQALLVPFFAVMLCAVVLALSLVWRSTRFDLLAVPVMLAAIGFGIAFGSSLMSPAWSLGDLSVPAPRETLIGAAGFLLSLSFLTGRAGRVRRAAQNRSAASGAGSRSLAGSARRASRAALTAAVLVTAVAVAVPAAAVPLRVDQRDVLRTAIEPELALREFVSPLSAYRGFLADDRFDTELLQLSSRGVQPDRLRLAVMSYYDGEVFRVVDPARGVDERSTAFARTPGVAVGTAAETTLDVTVGGYNEVWMPLAGQLDRVDFHGSRKQALTDGFFYNERTAAGVQLNQLREGDSFTVRASAAVAADPSALAAARKPRTRAELFDESVFPESLGKWVEAQSLGSSDGAALQELITRLRQRGYLSHSLTAAGPEGHKWQQEHQNYAFAPSLAGHSVGRIDMLFSSLLDKQNATSTSDNTELVAAVGDDEQFAVAAALLAESLGFPARVVLGFRLGVDGAAAPASGMPACADGSCSGRNLSAWIEVQDDGGQWITVDVTPQYEHPLSPSEELTRDPQNTTEVITDGATEVTPPDAEPAGGGESPKDEGEQALDLAWLFTALKIAGLVLLVLLLLVAPLLAMTLAKALRRRSRRRAADTTARIAGGWDDYVDTAVDLGLPAPGTDTRTELAARYDSPNGHTIAVLADEAVFGPVDPGRAEGDAFWAAVDTERALLSSEFSRWQRLRARLSLRSFSQRLRAKAPRNG
ncbi:transglutaminase-like domain-containing protein [Microterricola viridarii]|uniref:Transglutaminase-like domain-containing protein n=1 Tax=Microterricola viridarii TaxID=412690 RepID=A0A109QWB5_9MICO|nr:transglutaminase-like domain-containing protein [Microterricola viridarii]AMB57649.1 hypothetical protein AWU67_00870 [Microterricola viridarii]